MRRVRRTARSWRASRLPPSKTIPTHATSRRTHKSRYDAPPFCHGLCDRGLSSHSPLVSKCLSVWPNQSPAIYFFNRKDASPFPFFQVLMAPLGVLCPVNDPNNRRRWRRRGGTTVGMCCSVAGWSWGMCCPSHDSYGRPAGSEVR